MTRNGQPLLSRPDDRDERDRELLTQTHLEQISANQGFRPIAEYFAKVNYFHLVPRVIRHGRPGADLGAREFGSSMIADMNATPSRTRNAWFRRITTALVSAVPGFDGTTASLLSQIEDAGPEIEAEIPFSEIASALISPGDLAGLVKAARR